MPVLGLHHQPRLWWPSLTTTLKTKHRLHTSLGTHRTSPINNLLLRSPSPAGFPRYGDRAQSASCVALSVAGGKLCSSAVMCLSGRSSQIICRLDIGNKSNSTCRRDEMHTPDNLAPSPTIAAYDAIQSSESDLFNKDWSCHALIQASSKILG